MPVPPGAGMAEANGPVDEVGAVTRVLDVLENAADESSGEGRVPVAAIVAGLGERSFAPLLLVPALILVTPISSIPGMPTLGALLIGLVTAQMLLGRRSIWLPRWLGRRSIRRARLKAAIRAARPAARWIDRRVRLRLRLLTRRPLSYFPLLTCLAITLVMPLMEFVPALATVAAFAITLFAIGMMTRDGIFIIVGYAFVGGTVALAGIIV